MSSLKQEKMIHTNKKPFHCSHCDKSFTQKSSLKRHMMIYTNEKPFSCSHCDTSFTRKDHLKRHRIIHTNEKPFRCSHCDRSFTQKSSLKIHIMMIHTNEKPFRCSHCDRSFTQKSNLKIHIMMIHNNEKPFRCSHCDRSFTQKSDLKRHMMIHTNEKPFSCSHCDTSFARKEHLKRHRMIHTNEKPFSCPHCDRSFTQKSSLKIHIMMIHTNEEPFRCSHCDRSFTQKIDLKRHMIFHTNKKPFSCSHCDSSFIRKGHLKQHKIIHTNEKPFRCSYCDRSFPLKSNFKRHKMIHADGNPSSCFHCGKSFANKSTIKMHMLTHINDNIISYSHGNSLCNPLQNLKKHMMIHTKDKPFSRDDHGRSFNQKFSSEKHMIIRKNGKSNLSLPKKTAVRKLEKVHAENKETSAASFTSKSFNGDDSEKKIFMDIHNSISLARNQPFFKEESLKNDLLIHKQNESPTSSRYSQLPSREKSELQLEVVSCIDNSFVCSLCCESFLEKEAFENHVLTHTSNESTTFASNPEAHPVQDKDLQAQPTRDCSQLFICPYCNQSFLEKEALEKCLLIHEIRQSLFDTRVLIKSYCQNSSDLSPLEERKCDAGTRIILSNEQSFSCSKCEQFFLEKEALEKHKFFHNFAEECESILNISYSSQYFNSLDEGKTSIRDIQTGLKFHRCSQKCTNKAVWKSLTIRISRNPFCCADCSHSFPEMKSLKKHAMIHMNSKLKSYSCSNCGRSFTRKTALESHRLIHTIIPRYPCSQCSQLFAQKDELKQHVKLHSNQQLFTCSCCDQSFSYKRALKKHIISHKNQEIRSNLSNCQLLTKLTEHEITDLGNGMLFDHQENTNSRLHSASNNCVYQESNTSSVQQESPNLDLNPQTSKGVPHRLTNSVYQKNASLHPSFENICDPNPENMGHVHRENIDSLSSHNIENNTAEKLFSCFLCEQPFFEKDDFQLLSMVHDDEKHHTYPSCSHLFAELSMIRNDVTSTVANSVHEKNSNSDLHSEISDCIQQEGITSCSVS